MSKTTTQLAAGVLALALVATLSGCTAMTVRHDYDPDVDFGRYHTFAWMPLDASESVDGATLSGPFLDKHIKKAIVEALTARGFTYSPEGADFLVAYHLHYRNKRQLQVYGYGYGPYLYRGPQAVQVDRFKEGTLVVDCVDPETTSLIWRGWSVSDLGLGTSPEDEREHIGLAVRAIVERFPPYGPQRR